MLLACRRWEEAAVRPHAAQSTLGACCLILALQAYSLCLLPHSLLQAAKVITANAASVGDTLLGVPLLCSTGLLRPRWRGMQRGVQFIGAALYHTVPRCSLPCKRRWPVLCRLRPVACSLLVGICIICTNLSSNPPSHYNHPQASTPMQPASCRTRGCGATPPHWWRTPSSVPAAAAWFAMPAVGRFCKLCARMPRCTLGSRTDCVHNTLRSPSLARP